MPEITRLIGGSNCFESDFLKREVTPKLALKRYIRLYMAGLSLSDTISVLDILGSIGVVPPFIIGFRRRIYSLSKALTRIPVRLTKP